MQHGGVTFNVIDMRAKLHSASNPQGLALAVDDKLLRYVKLPNMGFSSGVWQGGTQESVGEDAGDRVVRSHEGDESPNQSDERLIRHLMQQAACVDDMKEFEGFVSGLHDLTDALKRSAPLKSLVSQMDRLTPLAVRSAAFHTVLAMTSNYPARCKVVHLRQLVDLVELLPRGDRSWATAYLLAATQRLPVEYRAGMLASLCTSIRSASFARRTAIFKKLLPAILALREQDQAAPLATLVSQLQWLPCSQRLPAFDSLLNGIARLPSRMRAFRLADMGAAIDWLNRADRQSAAERLLAAH